MDTKARDQLVRARIDMIMLQPFFGTLALRLELVEDLTCPTLWVDGKRVGYKPDFIKTLTHDLTTSAIAHEVGHCIFEHISRRGPRNPNKWNRAGDYVINAMLKDAGFKLGDGWLYDAQYAGMTADAIYNLLPDYPEDKDDSLCEIRQSEADPKVVDEWKLATAMAANAARSNNKLPESLERFVDSVLNPKADWRTVLRRFCTEETKDDYSWMRPNKHYISAGFYIPSLYSHGMGEIDIVVDTSGSISQKILDVFGGEVQAVRDTVRPALTRIIYCDDEIRHVDEYGPNDPIKLIGHGGGSTDFRPPFELIEKNGWRPAALLYLTDLYGPAPEAPPDYPVLWCCITSEKAPWGERVEIEV